MSDSDERTTALADAGSDEWQRRVGAASRLVRYDDDECLTTLGRLLCDWRDTAPAVAAGEAIVAARRPDLLNVLCAAIAVASTANSERITPTLTELRFADDAADALEELGAAVRAGNWPWARRGLVDAELGADEAGEQPVVVEAADLVFDLTSSKRVESLPVLLQAGTGGSDLALQALGYLLVEDQTKDHLDAVGATTEAIAARGDRALTGVLFGALAVAPPEHGAVGIDVLRRAVASGGFDLEGQVAAATTATDPWTRRLAVTLPGLLGA